MSRSQMPADTDGASAPPSWLFVTDPARAAAEYAWLITALPLRQLLPVGDGHPVLVLPDEVPAHPYAVAMECAMLAPKAEVSLFPWKEPKDRIPLAVRQIHSFLKAHQPA